jgi:lysozyme|tara:strand:+ start:943 stop:1386 length:444 start_codon:yes stop_codon:yes gene_type:complete
MKISLEGLSLIKRFEGCRLKAYKCSAGVLTIGYGHTGGVTETDTITQDDANKLLQEDVAKFEEYVDDNVIVELNQGQFDALVAWTFNLGPGNLRESTMLKKLNEADYTSVPNEMKRWNKAGGKTLDGLIRRRNAEALLFQSKEWHQV